MDRSKAMREDQTTDRQARPASPWWTAIKGALIAEDPVASARRGRAASGAAPQPDEGSGTSGKDLPGLAQPPLSPMARKLFDHVMNRATAYTALTDKLAPLEPIVPDERTRFQAAYALIKGSRSLEQVVQAIDLQHLPALEAEVTRFAAQLKDTERREIERRAEEVAALNSGIDARHEQMARLREQLEGQIRTEEASLQADRQRVSELTREMDAKKQELNAMQGQFDSATQQVKTLLEQARAQVLRHLG